MSDKDFVNSYLKDFSNLIKPNEDIIGKIISTRDILVEAKNNNKKITSRAQKITKVVARKEASSPRAVYARGTSAVDPAVWGGSSVHFHVG